MDYYICSECHCPYDYYYNKDTHPDNLVLSKSGYHYFENKYYLHIKEFFMYFYKKIIHLFKKKIEVTKIISITRVSTYFSSFSFIFLFYYIQVSVTNIIPCNKMPPITSVG